MYFGVSGCSSEVNYFCSICMSLHVYEGLDYVNGIQEAAGSISASSTNDI